MFLRVFPDQYHLKCNSALECNYSQLLWFAANQKCPILLFISKISNCNFKLFGMTNSRLMFSNLIFLNTIDRKLHQSSYCVARFLQLHFTSVSQLQISIDIFFLISSFTFAKYYSLFLWWNYLELNLSIKNSRVLCSAVNLVFNVFVLIILIHLCFHHKSAFYAVRCDKHSSVLTIFFFSFANAVFEVTTVNSLSIFLQFQ